jgi:hypothetical protein
LYPVLLGDFFLGKSRGLARPARSAQTPDQSCAIGVRLEQGDDARALPAWAGDRSGLAELRRFVGGAGVGILDADGQRSFFKERVGQRLGVQAVGLDTEG